MQNFLLRKNYKDNIYNYRPAWILRWGLLVIFGFIFFIISLSSLIKYPNIVSGYAIITTMNPTLHLKAKINGRIERIFVSEGEPVKVGSLIASIESSVRLNDIKILDENLLLTDSIIAYYNSVKLPHPDSIFCKLEIGDLQVYYSELLISYTELYNFNVYSLIKEKSIHHKIQYSIQDELRDLLSEKYEIMKMQSSIAKGEFLRDSILYLGKFISDKDFGLSHQRNVLEYQFHLAEIKSQLVSSQFSILEIEHALQNIDLQYKSGEQQLLSQFKAKFQLFKSSFEGWKQTYFFISPIDGWASYSTLIAENQNIISGEVIVSVIPKDSLQFKSNILFPIKNSGKVAEGQRVNIKLENFPYLEFGMLVGKINNISKIPKDTLYSADVYIPRGMVTSYGEELPHTNQLIGIAEILTDDSNLLVRLFAPIKSIFDERIK